LTAHVRRYHKHYHSSGHVGQGRFKAFPIEEDEHLLTVLRYIERNALRAELVRRVEKWPWSSLPSWQAERVPPYLQLGPVTRPRRWLDYVQTPLTPAELERVRRSVNRGAPLGSAAWSVRTAQQLGLEASLRPRGRPPFFS
jgi:putative transposase